MPKYVKRLVQLSTLRILLTHSVKHLPKLVHEAFSTIQLSNQG